MEKIISIKKSKVVEKDDKDWVEITDQEDKRHRVFRSVQDNDGAWVHLDKEVDMLKSKIEDGTLNGLALKLTKQKKGNYWNVVGVELVKGIFEQQAVEKIQKQTGQDREDSIESQVAFKGMIELMVAGIIKPDSTEGTATINWALGRLNPAVEIVSVIEKATPKIAIVEEEPKNAKELLNWIVSKDPSIKMPRTWLNENFAVDSKTVLNPEKVKELYKAIKIGMGW